MTQKYPLLRCRVCGFEYRPSSSGWAFRTDKNTQCMGYQATLISLEKSRSGNPIRVSENPYYNHPFVQAE